MTPLERVGTVLQGQEPDRVPAVPIIMGVARRVYGVTYAEWAQDGELQGKCAVQAQELIGHDAVFGAVDLSVEAADFGQEMVFPVEDTPHPNYDNPFIKSPEDYAKIPQVDPTKSQRMRQVLKYLDIAMNELGSSVPVIGFCYGPLGVLSMMRGAETLFRDCMKHRDMVIEGLERVTDVLEDYIRAQTKLGVHGLCLDTLFASSCIMSRKLWEATEAPYVKRLADTIREGGSMVMVHNCGTGIYFDVQMEAMEPIAISFAHNDADCTDMTDLKQKWGDKTTLCGYVDPATCLFLGNPDEVKQESKRQIQELGRGGRFMLTSGCEFPPNGSLLNAIAMVEAAELYGRYPMD